MNSFALFRLPYEQVVTRVVQHDRQPVAGQVFSDVYRQKGFVFAPFAVSDDCPLLLIRADEVCKCPLDELTEELLRSELGSPFLCESSWRKTGVTDERTAYHEAFGLFHGALSDGTFNKLVLSRCSHVSGSTVSPFHLFLRIYTVERHMADGFARTADRRKGRCVAYDGTCRDNAAGK